MAYRLILAAATLSFALLAAKAPQQAAYNDTFDRPNSAALGVSWTESKDPNCITALQIHANSLRTTRCRGAFAFWNGEFTTDQLLPPAL